MDMKDTKASFAIDNGAYAGVGQQRVVTTLRPGQRWKQSACRYCGWVSQAVVLSDAVFANEAHERERHPSEFR